MAALKLTVHLRSATASTSRPARPRTLLAGALTGLTASICLGALPAVAHRPPASRVVGEQAIQAPRAAENETGYADAGQPATRRPVKPSLTANYLPTADSAAISEMVKPVGGCTHTVVGGSVITAAHCHPAGFSTEGDIAWDGTKPMWIDPALISPGATIYAVGYPRANPGPQSFALTALGVRSVPMEGKSIDVLMAFGEGVPCTPGSSGMIAWVTIDNQMVPIGPMSVYSTNPAITGLPQGQYVCGFAV